MLDNMTIADYLKMKLDTEEKVRELLNDFSNKTGAEVISLSADVSNLVAKKGGYITRLEIEAKL